MGTILDIEEQPNVEEMAAFLKSLPERERLHMSAMFQGYKLCLQLAEESGEKETA